MIRRTVRLADGHAAWLLISQRDHALLASELSRRARPWTPPGMLDTPGPPAETRDEVEWAIRHHDDGWQDWDAHPGLDDETGCPRAFDEMRVADANEIWARSIELARHRGPLAAWLVTRHFLHLRSVSSSAADPDAIAFAQQFDPRADLWWRQWTDTPAARELPDPVDAARLALDRLRWADRLSLLLCGEPPADGGEQIVRPTPVGESQRLAFDPGMLPLDHRRLPQEVVDLRTGAVTRLSGESSAYRFGYRLEPWLADSAALGSGSPGSTPAPARPGSPDPRVPARAAWGFAFRLMARQVPVASYASVQELNQAAREIGILGVMGRSGWGAD